MCIQLRTRESLFRLLGRTRTAEERGAELVEAAIIISLLTMLFLGIIWFGRGYNVAQTITRAAREGARFAVAPTCASCGNTFPSASETQAVVAAALSASSLDPALGIISVDDPVTLNPGSTPAEIGLRVTVAYPFQFVLPFTSLHLTTITLSTQVQMRKEI